MIRLFYPAIFATTMLTAVASAHAAGGLYKHDASIAHHGYNVPIVDTAGSLTQSGSTLRQDIDKGYTPPANAARSAQPVYQRNTSANAARPASNTAPAAQQGGNANAGLAANLQGIAQGSPAQQTGAQGSVSGNAATTVTSNSINAGAGGSVVSGAATSPQAAETSPTAPIGRNSTDSIRSRAESNGSTIAPSNSGSNLNSGATANSPLGSSSSNSSTGSSSSSSGASSNGAADGGSGFTGDASNSGSTSTSNGGVGGSNGGSSSVGGGSSIGNASGGSLGGGAGAGAGGGQ